MKTNKINAFFILLKNFKNILKLYKYGSKKMSFRDNVISISVDGIATPKNTDLLRKLIFADGIEEYFGYGIYVGRK